MYAMRINQDFLQPLEDVTFAQALFGYPLCLFVYLTIMTTPLMMLIWILRPEISEVGSGMHAVYEDAKKCEYDH